MAEKWEETVLQPRELATAITENTELPMGQAIAKYQAKISFEAGAKSRDVEINHLKEESEARLELTRRLTEKINQARQEVVSFLREDCLEHGSKRKKGNCLFCCADKFLEWGIK